MPLDREHPARSRSASKSVIVPPVAALDFGSELAFQALIVRFRTVPCRALWQNRCMTRRIRTLLGVAALLTLLGGCYSHSFPERLQRFGAAGPDRANVFVDSNGTFYPRNWENHFQPGVSWSAHSLLREAQTNPALQAVLGPEQERQKAELQDVIGRAERIFIFIHGFNNNQRDAAEPFSMLEQRIVARPGDAIIRFHWDGLDDRVFGSPLLFWRNAAGNSQMAGTRALRPILQMTREDQEVILISHSRGASVILSALSNPRYDPDFARVTRAHPFFQGEDPIAPPELRRPHGTIDVVMLAPAIGRVDFAQADCTEDDATNGLCEFRAFPALNRLHYTVNPCDEVLDKMIGLSNRFNPTYLGLAWEGGEEVVKHYAPRIKRHRIVRPHTHAFARYTADPELLPMLARVDVPARPWLIPPPAKTCRRHQRELTAQAAAGMPELPLEDR